MTCRHGASLCGDLTESDDRQDSRPPFSATLRHRRWCRIVMLAIERCSAATTVDASMVARPSANPPRHPALPSNPGNPLRSTANPTEPAANIGRRRAGQQIRWPPTAPRPPRRTRPAPQRISLHPRQKFGSCKPHATRDRPPAASRTGHPPYRRDPCSTPRRADFWRSRCARSTAGISVLIRLS